jgi:hypothetical protein
MNTESHMDIPDWKLERYILGELPTRELARIGRALEVDDSLRRRLDALERSDQEIRDRYTPSRMSRQIQRRLKAQEEGIGSRAVSSPFPRLRPLVPPRPVAALSGAALAAVLLLVVLPRELHHWKPGKGASMERVKGEGPQLRLHRRTPDGSELLPDGARVFEGDVIQIGYQSAGRPYGVIVSVDGRGTVAPHLPLDGTRAVELGNEGQILLDFALELDDAPGWERFYLVTGDRAFELAPVLRAARKLDTKRPVDRAEKLDLGEDLEQFVVSLEKGTRR